MRLIMMKFFYFILLTTTTYASTSSTSSEEFVDNRVQMLKEYLNRKVEMRKMRVKFESVCPEQGDKFEASIAKMQDCVDLIDKSEETVCSAIKYHFETCSKPLVRVMEECLPEKSKELPTFVIKTIVAITNHTCKIDGEHIFELSNSCIMNNSHRMRRCLLKTTSRLQQYQSATPTKSEVCEFVKSMRQCFKSHLEVSCGNAITREAFMGLFDSALNQCEDADKYFINEVV